jgi:Na+/H+-dicarboxylate symporter
MPKNILSTILKLFVISLIVGLLMHWLGVTPRSLISNFGATVERLFGTLANFVGWAINYVLLGACIVVPIWLLIFLVERAKGRRGS